MCVGGFQLLATACMYTIYVPHQFFALVGLVCNSHHRLLFFFFVASLHAMMGITTWVEGLFPFTFVLEENFVYFFPPTFLEQLKCFYS